MFTTRSRYRAAECTLTLTCVSIIRANVTHILARTHTATQYSYISLLLHQAGRSTTGKQYAKVPACKGNRQPGALL